MHRVIRVNGEAIHADVISVPIGLHLLLGAVVAGATQALPVGPIPEQRGITTVRDDVVNHLSSHNLITQGMEAAQRVLG